MRQSRIPASGHLSGGFFPGDNMTDLVALKAANEKRWANAKLTHNFSTVARHLVASDAKARYQAVSAKTGVPWAAIAVIHERECSQNWAGSLAQGDPWNRVSVHVPAGRGPFKSWEDAAIDALVHCAPYAARNADWGIGGTLTKLEEYNGLGYAARGQPSPYIWSGTDQYRSGKYVRDGVYDPKAVDTQLGCAGLLMAMMALDPSIRFDKVAPPAANAVPSPSSKPSKPSLASPSRGSVGAFVASLIAVLFKRR
jgi:lysozyme family protein